MQKPPAPQLTPIAFLQTFAAQSLRPAKRLGCNQCEGDLDYVEHIDREVARHHLGEEYASDNGRVVSQATATQLRERVEEKIHHVWCMSGRDTDAAAGAGSPKIVAESAAMRRALEAVEIVAPTAAAVLVTGETGVGKEIVAKAVYALSPRHARNLVAINAGAIAESLLETVLFGHEKGAFTGAYDVHRGLFERADRGTLFLDEIDCLPVSAQAKLLRALQEGEFERVGGR
jgi:two-component system response regulator AtoC